MKHYASMFRCSSAGIKMNGSLLLIRSFIRIFLLFRFSYIFFRFVLLVLVLVCVHGGVRYRNAEVNSDRKIKFKVIGSIDFIHSCYPLRCHSHDLPHARTSNSWQPSQLPCFDHHHNHFIWFAAIVVNLFDFLYNCGQLYPDILTDIIYHSIWLMELRHNVSAHHFIHARIAGLLRNYMHC